MILERSDHPLPAGDALVMTYLEGITDRFRDLKLSFGLTISAPVSC